MRPSPADDPPRSTRRRVGLSPTFLVPLLAACPLAAAAPFPLQSASRATPDAHPPAGSTAGSVASAPLAGAGAQGPRRRTAADPDPAASLQAGAARPTVAGSAPAPLLPTSDPFSPTAQVPWGKLDRGYRGTLESNQLVLEYEFTLDLPGSPGFVLRSLGDPEAPDAFLFVRTDVWELELLPHAGDPDSQLVRVRPSDCDFQPVADVSQSSLTYTWSGCRTDLVPDPDFRFNVTLELAFTAALDSIVVEFVDVESFPAAGAPGTYSIYAVSFLAHLKQFSNPPATVLTMPWANGVQYVDPIRAIDLELAALESEFKPLPEHPGVMSAQRFLLSQPDVPGSLGAVFGTRDVHGDLKQYHVRTGCETDFPSPLGGVLEKGPGSEIDFDVQSEKGEQLEGTQASAGGGEDGCDGIRTLILGVRAFPVGNLAASSFVSEFPYEMGVLPRHAERGTDWLDLAEDYRGWAQQQAWWRADPVVTDPDASEHVKQSILVGRTAAPRCSLIADCSGKVGFKGRHPDLSYVMYWPGEVQNLLDYLQIPRIGRTAGNSLDHDSAFDHHYGDWLPVTAEVSAVGSSLPAAASIGAYFEPNCLWTGLAEYETPQGANHIPGIPPEYQDDPLQDFVVHGPVAGGIAPLVDPRCVFTKATPCNTDPPDGSHGVAGICHATEFLVDYSQHVLASYAAEVDLQTAYLDQVSSGPARLCYATGSAHLHAPGNTREYTQIKLAFLDRLRAFFRTGTDPVDGDQLARSAVDEDFYLSSEGPNELFLGRIEVFQNNLMDVPQNGYLDEPFRRIVPLFRAIYGGRTVVADATRLPGGGPFDDVGQGGGNDPVVMARFRQQLASVLSVGYLPGLVSFVSDTTVEENAAAYVPYATFMAMLRDCLQVFQHQPVRDFMVLGRLLRAPSTDAPRIELEVPLPPPDPLPAYFTGSHVQPVVMAGAFGHPTRTDEVGIALVNWTEPTDTATELPTLDPALLPLGDRDVVVTLDPDQLGLPHVLYEMIEVDAAGAEQHYFDLSFSGGSSVGILVPTQATSLRFFCLRPKD